MAANTYAVQADELPGLIQVLEEARREWDAARNLFSEVVEPDLIDVAIFRLEAAERRYMYYWKRACQVRELARAEGEMAQ